MLHFIILLQKHLYGRTSLARIFVVILHLMAKLRGVTGGQRNCQCPRSRMGSQYWQAVSTLDPPTINAPAVRFFITFIAFGAILLRAYLLI